MESLGDILKRHQRQERPSQDRRDRPDEPGEMPAPCEKCRGHGWLTRNVQSVSDPDFGRLFPCECQMERIAAEKISRLHQYSGLGELTQSTFETFSTVGPDSAPFDAATQTKLEVALSGAEQYATQPAGWLIMQGPSGSGKTHLAAAVANKCIEKGMPVFFAHVPTILDHLRSAFDKDSEVGHTTLFEQVRDAPILVLDELDTDDSTSWAHGKLKQILNHRHNNGWLPTIVTTTDMSRLDPYMVTRMEAGSRSASGRILSMRPQLSSAPWLGLKEFTPSHSDMTLGKFTIRHELLPDTARSLRTARALAEDYSKFVKKPWLTLFGPHGTGKTHLAMAIVNELLRHESTADWQIFVTEVRETLTRLRDSLSPGAREPYFDLVEQMKAADLLVLDGFEAADVATGWAKDLLVAIAFHRYNNRKPTIFTTTADVRKPDGGGPLISRLNDESVCELAKLEAPDYRRSI